MTNQGTDRFEVRLTGTFDEAVDRVVATLADRGFGILTRIDLKAAFEEKLGEPFRDYVILGACNPKLAHRALSARPDVGLLLPCNVTVEMDVHGGPLVRLTNPRALFEAADFERDAEVAEVAGEAERLLHEVARALADDREVSA